MNNNHYQKKNQEEIAETFSEVEINEIREQAIKQAKEAKHRWVQKGVWLVCKSCEMRHGFYIGREKMLVGYDELGKPILKDRSQVLRKKA